MSDHDEEQARSLRVDRFLIENIDTVPHLEALLFLWKHAPQAASPEEMAKYLYVTVAQAQAILEDLAQRGLLSRVSGPSFFFRQDVEARNHLLQAVEETYRRELIRISGLIHSKASPGLRAFAHAFQFRKNRG